MNLSGSQVYTGWNPNKECWEIKVIQKNETLTIDVSDINKLEMLIGQLNCLKLMMGVEK